jgi:CubicO group peptidase (beta-lactamase class C family)
MNSTGVDNLDTVLPFRAQGYSRDRKRTWHADFIAMEWPFSAGVIYSTLEDLYKWDRALLGAAVLSTASKQKMFTPGKSNYGYGIIIDSLEKHYRIWHNGGIPGFSTNLSRYVDDDIFTTVLSNNESPVDFISIALGDILFDVPVELPYEHKEVKIDPSLLDR